MAYDSMGNYTGDYETADPSIETEEQKRLRLQREDAARRAAITQPPAFLPEAATGGPVAPDMADKEVHSQTIKTYGDGTQEEITKKQIPAGQNYNTYTGQQESGNNPNIGFHYPADASGQRKSSAYGTYGLTANAYKDIQAANPAFANRPLESLTPEEQTQANDTYRGVLGKQLQAKGVEPTEENTRLAHLLGAQGAARYLQNKTVSSQAAAANGGEARLKQIADARMAGQNAPASGAAVANNQMIANNAPNRANLSQGIGDETGAAMPAPVQPEMVQPPAEAPPAAPVNPEQALAPGSTYSLAQGGSQPGIRVAGMTTPLTEGTQLPMAQQRFQANQDNVQELLNMRNDASMPEHLRQRSADRAYELLQNERMKSAAEQKFQGMVAAGDNKGIADAVQGRAKGQEGSFLKMIALGFISPQLAGVEAEKLGLAPTKWEQTTITNEDGTTTGVEIKRSVSGKILEASHMDGSALSSDEMSQLNAMGGKKVHSAQTLINPDTKQVVTQQVLSDGTMRYMAGGRVYTGNKEALIPEAAYTAQVNKKEMAAEKTANKQEEQRQKSEDRRVEGAIKTLEKRVPNPTIEQRKQALVQAGVAAARIEQELGMAEGSLSGQVPVAPVQQAPVQQNRPAVVAPNTAPTKPVARDESKIGQLGARPVEPAPVEPVRFPVTPVMVGGSHSSTTQCDKNKDQNCRQ
jgi:hypothetical protein